MAFETDAHDSESWFQRLGNAIFSVLVPTVNFLATDHGKAKTITLDQAVLIERYMMGIPTDYCNGKKLSDGTLIPIRFPIAQRRIKAWKQHFVDIGMHELLLPKLAGESKSNAVKENVKEIEMIDSVPAEDLNEAHRFEEDIESAQLNQILVDVNVYLFLRYN
jgi:hypothetical protein